VDRLAARKEWPLEVLKQVMTGLMKGVPRGLLERQIWSGSSSSWDWWQRQQAHTRSSAVMSMVGDRLLSHCRRPCCTEWGEVVVQPFFLGLNSKPGDWVTGFRVLGARRQDKLFWAWHSRGDGTLRTRKTKSLGHPSYQMCYWPDCTHKDMSECLKSLCRLRVSSPPAIESFPPCEDKMQMWSGRAPFRSPIRCSGSSASQS